LRTLGIDEAGRGCVLGALYVAGFVVDDVDDSALTKAGACDSKAISAVKRLAAREKLRPLGQPDVRPIPPFAIDENSLNALEEDVIVALIDRWKPDRVIIDALGHPRSLPGIVKRLAARAPCAEWIMEPKADATYPVVGAASIFAKTHRDEALDELATRFGVLGSGYPSDPETKAWLAAHHATGEPWPAFVRTKWATITNFAQQSLL
jgi:ribonuclease HII